MALLVMQQLCYACQKDDHLRIQGTMHPGGLLHVRAVGGRSSGHVRATGGRSVGGRAKKQL